eukprot:6198716-Pleurochrysis_carterae.AAC.2
MEKKLLHRLTHRTWASGDSRAYFSNSLVQPSLARTYESEKPVQSCCSVRIMYAMATESLRRQLLGAENAT